MTSSVPEVVDFPLRRPGQQFPPIEYAGFRRRNGLVKARLAGGNLVWVVTRHADVRAVLMSPKISSNPDREGFPNVGETLGVPRSDQIPGWFVGFDPPDHGRVRKALIPEFSARRMRALRPAVQRTVDERVDAVLARGGAADLVADFALPVPSLVISALLGVPSADHDFWESRTRPLVSILSSTDEQRETAIRELLRYLNRLISLRQKWPGDDLISRQLEAGVLGPQELSGALLLLLIAGHETTANNIALGVVTLLANPHWIGDDRMVPELLRLHSVADLVAMRVAVEDVEIAGQLIRAGEGIMPLVAAANHDESVYESPHEFQPARPVRQHVAFGYGAHQCLGQNLVYLEMEIAFRALFERIPELRLSVPADRLSFKYDGVIFGLCELPVTW
jgi:cytochrome P450 monooxygenase